MKVVINRAIGGFSLSVAGIEYYYRLKGVKEFYYYIYEKGDKYQRITKNRMKQLINKEVLLDMDVYVLSKDFGEGLVKISSEDISKYRLTVYGKDRSEEDLIKTVMDLGAEASHEFSYIVIVEIPDDVQWQIEEEAGVEWVAEVHRTWGKGELD